MSAEDVHLMMQMQEDFQSFSLRVIKWHIKRLVGLIENQYGKIPPQDISSAPVAQDEYAPNRPHRKLAPILFSLKLPTKRWLL